MVLNTTSAPLAMILRTVAVFHVIEREIFFADDRAAVGRDQLPDPLVHDVRQM